MSKWKLGKPGRPPNSVRLARTKIDVRKAPVKEADTTDVILEERGNVHGRWEDNARISRTFRSTSNNEARSRIERGQRPLTPSEHEAIDMILHKCSRILAGDPSHADHWDDIGGYARLGRNGHQ